jgi:predicted nucleotidyltransferase
MVFTDLDKESIKRDLAVCLRCEKEVRKIVVFGSFLNRSDPRDIDVAVFQDSKEGYLPLALKYRKLTRSISSRIPLDIIPLRSDVPSTSFFLKEINTGEVVYER